LDEPPFSSGGARAVSINEWMGVAELAYSRRKAVLELASVNSLREDE